MISDIKKMEHIAKAKVKNRYDKEIKMIFAA